jgi:PAS domain S-box-containing protein
MASTNYLPTAVHRPFTTLSPTIPPDATRPLPDGFRGQDTLVSNPSTPASNMTFLPPGCPQTVLDHRDFPSPNLYELSLMLSAEPGLDAWWHTVVQIMVDVYKAERVTLAIPADSTDIENVPWGQKATYNAHREDDLSMGYLARGSSFIASSTGVDSEPFFQAAEPARKQEPMRPGLQSRHSYTSYEQNRQTPADERALPAQHRPHLLSRSKSHHQSSTPAAEPGNDANNSTSLNQEALEQHDALEEQQQEQQEIPSWEAPLMAPREGHGKVLNVLQALDYEADPLIDHNGVVRILERGRVVALTRSYPYLNHDSESGAKNPADARTPAAAKSPEGPRKKLRRPRSDSMSKLSSILGGATFSPVSTRVPRPALERKLTSRVEDEPTPQPPTPKYEEFEQAPPSPWSQSPAPSPAVRPDPAENPFFTDAMVDEESFNPSGAPADYSAMVPPEAIGVDNSWTVLHIPLTHVLLSRPNPSFKLDPSLMEQKISARKAGDASAAANLSPERPVKEKHAPIAILSILSPIIPYPSNLRHSLEHLAPHLATSFSLCRHYSNLETELSGLQKRRPQTAGFGALGPDGRLLADPTALASFAYLPAEDTASRNSLAGSMTSPSDYSGPARSIANSPSGTPNWDPSSLGFLMDSKRGGPTSSPAPVNADSYFSSMAKGPANAGQRARRNSREMPAAEKRSSLRLSGGKVQLHDPASASPTVAESRRSTESLRHDRQDAEESLSASAQQRRAASAEKKELVLGDKSSAAAAQAETQKTAVTPSLTPHRHTQLHSYGADFASTFQSLPPSSTISRGVPHPAALSRTGSIASTDMTPPSDKLKGLMLDSLPAHVFVALPQTGEIVWVNSRFLAYRGQTSSDLAADPWGSIHPDDRDDYLHEWSQCVRSGGQFAKTVRIRRFDGAYRWFYARAVASKDKRGVIMQFLGSYMDIHDQHIAEVKAARQEEVLASEAKHRLLANLIPQIIFTATEDEGITFANEQWLSYTGQLNDGVLGLGFMDYVHPDDLAKCRIPLGGQSVHESSGDSKRHGRSFSADYTATRRAGKRSAVPDGGISGADHVPSRNSSSSSAGSGSNDGTTYDLPTANLTELAKKGVIKVSTDSSGRLSYTTEIRLRSKSDEYRWHLIRCVEIDNVDFGNGASSYFGSATDINDLKLLETKLKEAMDSKGRFLSNMSHEIRTPLIGISGMVSFLQDTTLNEEQRDYTNTIQTSANSLLMIINDILDLSKVDAGMMKLNYEWFHTRSLIEDVNELVSTMAIAKRLELNYVVEEDVPAYVKGDKVRIRQVLLNVIGNAIKFTNRGEVFSKCTVFVPQGVELGKDEIMLEFSIVDTGRGFTKEEADLIFKPFSQIDGSSTRQHGGSGLGLVISRQLVELHGGKMEGTAVPGKGSTFTFTAKFTLPTENDHPDISAVPYATTPGPVQTTPLAPAQPPSVSALRELPSSSPSSTADRGVTSPAAASSGSSELSVSSSRTRATDRSSMSSVNAGLVRFSQAARASGQDLSQMKLEMPSRRDSPATTPTARSGDSPATKQPPPPMFSILIICPQTHSREATTKHIEMTLPKNIPHQITAAASVEEAHSFFRGEAPVRFTHIVVNLPSPEEIISLMDKVSQSESTTLGHTTILILSDSVQRQAVSKLVAGTKYKDILGESRVTYIYKPVKPSRFAVIFDPAKERDLSIDHNRSTAQRLVEDQRQSYVDMERRMGGKGYKVLLVEDNPVNQKVLQKYLKRVGVAVELAADGVECTDMVFEKGWGYYSLILVRFYLPPPLYNAILTVVFVVLQCDLHMPRKDGYQACREVRAWEAQGGFGALPIIALSANVMSDVQEKCVEAGFNDYVTKPVDFIDLSRALSKFF